MYSTSDDYKTAVAGGYTPIQVYISVGTNIDTTAADDVSGVTGDLLGLSSTGQINDAIYSLTSGMAVFEGDGIPTALSAGMVAPPLTGGSYPPETALWSAGISDADGAISWTVTISLSADHTSGLTLYTDGPSITAASAVFTAADGTTSTADFVCSDSYAQIEDAHTYSSIAITVTGISEAYSHVRIAEVEFGASSALSLSSLTSEITCIQELDPMEQTIPMDELDFSIINVDGSYDSDNPDSKLSRFAIGLPVLLSFTVVSDTSRWTIPMGRYWIGERTASDTSVSIAAFDGRWFLSQSTEAWSLSTATSLGASIETLLSDLGMPHAVDDALYDVYPDADYSFSDETDCLSDLLLIEQAYGVYCLPQRGGTIKVTQTWPSDAVSDAVPLSRILSWPKPQQLTRYNHLSVAYGNSAVTEDLRTAGEAKSPLQVSNPLITTESRATEVLARLKSRLIDTEVETRIAGDPSLDLGDSIPIPGRWTRGSPTSYTVRSVEWTWEGLFLATVRGTL